MPKGFSAREKARIRAGLLRACRENWAAAGYKKISVDELCREAGISKGAFYLFFPSKEALFCEVLCAAQEGINDRMAAILDEHRDRQGVAQALKAAYREYAGNRFLDQADSGDLAALMNRVSPEQADRLAAAMERSKALFLNNPAVRFKAEPQMALSVIYTLMMTIRSRDVLPCDHQAVFDFAVDHLIDDLFE